MSNVKPIPEGRHTLTPHIIVRNCAGAIDFYTRAFGATECFRMMAPDGKTIVHAEVRIGDSFLMLADEMPHMENHGSPEKIGGNSVTLHIYSENADAAFQQAIDAGATVTMPLSEQFWGDKYGRLRDPYGHEWSIATRVKDLTPEEIAKAGEELMKQGGECG